MDESRDQRAAEYSRFLKSLREARVKEKARSSAGRYARQRLTDLERNTILQKTKRRCHICGGAIHGSDWQADHVLALSGGGVHHIDNYLPAHSVCNNYRWDYLAEEFQEILKLGVWMRTQVEKQTPIGRAVALGYVTKEASREKRRKTIKQIVAVAQPAVAADRPKKGSD